MRLVFAILVVAILASGCSSKPKPRSVPTFVPVQAPPPPRIDQRTHVTIQGQVRNPVIPWTQDLTLSQALVMGDYFGERDPQSIVIFRGDKAIFVETRQLLGGVKDPPLLPGDTIELRR